MTDHINRREFVRTAGSAMAGISLFSASGLGAAASTAERRDAIVGTGDRSSGMWGRDLVD